jgi:hypothetical protein
MKSQRNPQGKMVDKQIANMTNKHLKKRKKNSGSGTAEFQS